MNSPLLFNPSLPEWGKFLFTGNMGFFLLAGIPLFWLGRSQESWLLMGCGILALASSSIFTCLAFYYSDGVVSSGFISGTLFGGFWGEGTLIAIQLPRRAKRASVVSNKKFREPRKGFDTKNHNERIKFIANSYNTIAAALIATALIPLMTNFILSPEKNTFNLRMSIFSIIVVLLASGLHLWARGMFNRLKKES